MKNSKKATFSALFAWFLLRPRALRRWMGRNHSEIMTLLQLGATITSFMLWPGIVLFLIGNPLGATLLTWWLLSLALWGILGLAQGTTAGWTIANGDERNTDHRWHRILHRKRQKANQVKMDRGEVIDVKPSMAPA